jgi:hypothetical protein
MGKLLRNTKCGKVSINILKHPIVGFAVRKCGTLLKYVKFDAA